MSFSAERRQRFSIIAFLSTLSALIAVIVFLTGKEKLADFLPGEATRIPFVAATRPVSNAPSLSLSGTWQGSLSQTVNGITSFYDFTMSLDQRSDSVVSGSSTIQIVNYPSLYGVMRLSGHLTGNTMYFEETQILTDRSPVEFDWCLKSGSLVLASNGTRLSGSWTTAPANAAFGCASGQIDLQRVS
jgi:hypothetical protein